MRIENKFFFVMYAIYMPFIHFEFVSIFISNRFRYTNAPVCTVEIKKEKGTTGLPFDCKTKVTERNFQIRGSTHSFKNELVFVLIKVCRVLKAIRFEVVFVGLFCFGMRFSVVPRL
jgi:hypothetical protein